MYRLRIFLFVSLSILFFNVSWGQNEKVIIRQIILEGNNHTKNHIILRELDIREGDTIYFANIQNQIEANRLRILSTGLFNDAKSNIKNWDSQSNYIDIVFTLEESWYLYPVPLFELADRSFNVWWKEQNHSFSRVNYGVRFDHFNLTGRKDRMKVKLQFGYTRKFELKYEFPYLSNNWGLTSEIFYSDNKEIGYKTESNKTLFYKSPDERKLLFRNRVGATVHKRTGVHGFQLFKLEFHHNRIDEVIAAEYNPNYFLDKKQNLRFFALEYDYKYDHRNLRQYPTDGFLLNFNVRKEGLYIFDDVNILSTFILGEYYKSYWDKLILSGKIKFKTNLTNSQIPFSNNTGLGYGEDILAGYELYVLDGSDYVYFKFLPKFKVLTFNVNFGKYMPLKEMRHWPMDIYLKGVYNIGYINESSYTATNYLNNIWLNGYGIGLDFLLFHNYLFTVEYQLNTYGDKGFFFKSGFKF
ncbi:MAG TPA: BamA/TamA family outer membrane protein [Saprospiraceae bacterium]|nr:BamA/TamA family outer membrane protein [Saprospiraceae bacterium]HPQ20334.1 BamA/TamA family outer membrane protein [Saprospiraceae bacterium]